MDKVIVFNFENSSDFNGLYTICDLYIKNIGRIPRNKTYKTSFKVNKSKDSPKFV